MNSRYLCISKGISDLKACLDYCEDLAKSCENLNFFFLFKQNRSSASVVGFLRVCLIFLSITSFQTNGREHELRTPN